MKRNKIEKRIFKAADALTPEPPSFESVTEGIDWDAVALSARPAPKRRRILIPVVAGGLGLCVIAAVTIPLAIHFSPKTDYYGEGGHKTILYGAFIASRWHYSDPEIDFSDSTLEVDKQKADGPSNAMLFEQNGDYTCSVHFGGNPFASFEFGTLSYTMGAYQGEAVYLGEKYSFSVGFPSSESAEKSIVIRLNNSSSSVWGSIHYAPVN